MSIGKRNNKNDEEEFMLSMQFRFFIELINIYYFINPKQSYDVFYFYKRHHIYF